jgi:nicotinate-nucleotide adenylyltransferase
MDLKELQTLVARSHERHFGQTQLSERMRDLSHQVAELTHHRDADQLRQELGDVAWAILQLCTETGVDFTSAVRATLDRLESKAQGKRVCLLGTSANPITNAHLTMGLEILALTNVDQVWYYVAGEHPWGKKLMPAQHRLEMVRRAIARYPRLRAFDFEIVHGAEIYKTTKETSFILKDHIFPAFPSYKFSWVMGSDAAQTFHKWGGAEWMAANLDFTIIHRLGYDFDKANSILAEDRHKYLRDDIVTSNISSTLVRERGKDYQHDRLLALVPDVVWDYLVLHRLLDPDALK